MLPGCSTVVVIVVVVVVVVIVVVVVVVVVVAVLSRVRRLSTSWYRRSNMHRSHAQSLA